MNDTQLPPDTVDHEEPLPQLDVAWGISSDHRIYFYPPAGEGIGFSGQYYITVQRDQDREWIPEPEFDCRSVRCTLERWGQRVFDFAAEAANELFPSGALEYTATRDITERLLTLRGGYQRRLLSDVGEQVDPE